MCGIAAVFASSPDAPNVNHGELIAIRDHMAGRGPDGAGEWISGDRRIGLAHRRLAIIDLSDTGAQPMRSADGSLVITFNGEIYNHRGLRRQLEHKGCAFRSQSDTEVLLHLYASRGAEMMHDLRGMYAFVIWDERNRTLFAARDPFGIKPLYYAMDGRTIRIASQVKALLQSKQIDSSPEPAGHVGFFLWGHVPEPFTLSRGIRALPAGHVLAVTEGGGVQVRVVRPVSAALQSAIGAASADRPSVEEAREILRSALSDTVQHHLVADVPVGSFLSSGLDSSTVTAFAAEGQAAMRTVTLGFDEYCGQPQDEVPLAEATARVLSTNHRTIRITRQDFEREMDRLFEAMDQPSIDGVNTYFVSLAARRTGLKVALSGLGGDEIFGGYPSFRQIPRVVSLLKLFETSPSLGRFMRVVSAPLLKCWTSPKYASLLEYGGSFGGAYLLRRGLFMPWELPELLEPEMVRAGWQTLQPLVSLSDTIAGLPSDRLKVAGLELCWYMRNQLLRDCDWASMAHSLEIRVPLVDLELLRTIVRLSVDRAGPTKADAARLTTQSLPTALFHRPKTGFSVPVRDWLLSRQHRSTNARPVSDRGLRGWAKHIYSQFTAN